MKSWSAQVGNIGSAVGIRIGKGIKARAQVPRYLCTVRSHTTHASGRGLVYIRYLLLEILLLLHSEQYLYLYLFKTLL